MGLCGANGTWVIPGRAGSDVEVDLEVGFEVAEEGRANGADVADR